MRTLVVGQVSTLRDSLFLHFHPLDLRAETCEFFIQHFVTAIDMIDTVDFRSSVSYQTRQNKRGRSSKITCHHRSPTEILDPVNSSGRPIQLDRRAHSFQL